MKMVFLDELVELPPEKRGTSALRDIYTNAITRGTLQAREIFKDTKNQCLLTCRPTTLVLLHLCENLNDEDYVVFNKAKNILRLVVEKTCWYGNRGVLAGGLVYISSIITSDRFEHWSQVRIADELNITEVSLRMGCRKILKVLNVETIYDIERRLLT